MSIDRWMNKEKKVCTYTVDYYSVIKKTRQSCCLQQHRWTWLEEGMATHSSILAWRIPGTEEPAGYSPQDCKESDMTEVTYHTCMHADEPRRHYAKRNKTRHRKTHTIWSHLYMESRKSRPTEPAIARTGVWQKWGDVGQWYKLSVTRWISSGNLMHSKVTIINNTVFGWNLLRE